MKNKILFTFIMLIGITLMYMNASTVYALCNSCSGYGGYNHEMCTDWQYIALDGSNHKITCCDGATVFGYVVPHEWSKGHHIKCTECGYNKGTNTDGGHGGVRYVPTNSGKHYRYCGLSTCTYTYSIDDCYDENNDLKCDACNWAMSLDDSEPTSVCLLDSAGAHYGINNSSDTPLVVNVRIYSAATAGYEANGRVVVFNDTIPAKTTRYYIAHIYAWSNPGDTIFFGYVDNTGTTGNTYAIVAEAKSSGYTALNSGSYTPYIHRTNSIGTWLKNTTNTNNSYEKITMSRNPARQQASSIYTPIQDNTSKYDSLINEAFDYHARYQYTAPGTYYGKIELRYTLDTTKPTVALNGTASPSTVNSSEVVIVPLKYSDAGTAYTASGVDTSTISASDITVKVGSTTVNPSVKTLIEEESTDTNPSYILLLSGLTGGGALTLSYGAEVFSDNAGNGNAATSIATGVTVDNTVRNYQVGSAYYATLNAAYNAITGSSGTIKVIASNTDSSRFEVASGKNITIDTGTQTVTLTSTGLDIAAGGFLNITGSGKIQSGQTGHMIRAYGTISVTSGTLEQTLGQTGYACVCIYGGGVLNVTGGKIVSALQAVKMAGTLYMSAGSIEAIGNSSNTTRAIFAEGTGDSYTITGGTIKSTNATGVAGGIYPSIAAVMKISNAQFISQGNGEAYCIYYTTNATGSVTISGSTNMTVSSNTSNATVIRAGVSASRTTTLVDFSSGTLTATTSAGIAYGIRFQGEETTTLIGNYDVLKMTGGTINVTGGSDASGVNNWRANGRINITGGTITSNYTGVYSHSCGTIVIGTQGGTLSTSVPVIIGDSNGIYSHRPVYFYDGIIKSKATPIYLSGATVTPETGYDIISGTDSSYKTRYLGIGNFSVNGEYYETLANAYAVITGTSGVIKVERNNTDTTAFEVANGKTIGLDTNGKTLTRTTEPLNVASGGTLNVTGTGTITSAASNKHLIINNGTLNITSATISHTGSANWTTAIYNNGTCTINSGNILGKNTTINQFGTINIKGGTIEANKADSTNAVVALYETGTAKPNFTITGGTIKATNTSGSAITVSYTHGGSFNMSAGSIIASGTTSARGMHVYTGDSESLNGSINISGTASITATATSGTAEAIITRSDSATSPFSILVSGGTITATASNIAYGIDHGDNAAQGATSSTESVKVTGGTITATGTTKGYGIRLQNPSGNLVITGGTVKGNFIGAQILRAGSIIVGTQGGGVSRTSPIIQGGSYSGVCTSTAPFYFYDGILKATADPYVLQTGGNPIVETGYEVVYGTESINSTTYNTGYLKQTSNLAASDTSVNYGSTITPTYTYNGDGTVTASSSSTTIATVSINTSTKTLTIVGKQVGTATITLTATEGTNYAPKTVTFRVTVNAITPTLTLGNKTATYTGSAISIGVATATGISGGTSPSGAITYTYYLNDGTTVTTATNSGASSSGAAPIYAGTYKVKATIAAAGNYTSASVIATLIINKAMVTPPSSPADKTYNKAAQAHGISVPSNSSVVSSGSTTSATNVGNYTLILKLNDTTNYTWTDGTTNNKNIPWKIVAYNLSNATISNIGNQSYTGSAITPSFSVTVPLPSGSSSTLTNNTDYTYTFSNNTAPGTATLTVTGKGNYTGTKTKTFTIVSTGINITMDSTKTVTYGTTDYLAYSYTGDSTTPTVSISDTAIATVTLEASNGRIKIEPKKAGTATITLNVPATANYNAKSATCTLTVNRANGSVVLSATSGSVEYGTASKTFTVSSSHGGTLSVDETTSTAATVGINGSTVTISTLGSLNASTTVKIKVTSAQTDTHNSASAEYVLTITQKNATLSASNISVNINSTISATYTYVGDGTVSATSNNTGVATVESIDRTNKKVTIKGIGKGTATITLSATAGTNYKAATATFTVTVADTSIKITTNPVDVSIKEKAGNVTFTVAATGTNMTYQWYSASSNSATGTIITGATSATYTISAANVTKNLNGTYYYCTVSNTSGSVSSTRALLTVYYEPTISTQPTSQTVTYPNSATFTLGATAGNPSTTTYQWQLSVNGGTTWNPISGATAASYSTGATTVDMNGYRYRCIISNLQYSNAATSNTVILTVNKATPTITLANKEVDYTGNQITIGTANVSGPTGGVAPSGTITYKYYSDSNCTTQLSVAPTNAGTYYVKATIAAAGNYTEATSSAATLKINKINPTLKADNVSVALGSSVDAIYTYIGDGTVSASSGKTTIATIGSVNTSTKKVTINSVAVGTATITLTSTEGENYKAATSTFTVTVTDAQITVTAPADKTVKEKSQDVTFSVTATGNNLKYQWYSATSNSATGTIISGATSSSYTIAAANVTQALNGKYYYCVVSSTLNASNTATSGRAKLTVYYPPVITTHPANKTVTYLDTATFTIAVTNGNPSTTTYKWQVSKDNGSSWSDISGATNVSYTTGAVDVSMNGYKYRCIIGNTQYPNVTTSNEATLTVNAMNVATSVEITLNPSSYTYDGSAKRPTITVKNKTTNATLVANTDYTFDYKNNTNVGTAIATITGKGNYTGTLEKTYTIGYATTTVTTAITGETIVGKELTVSATTVSDGQKSYQWWSSDTPNATSGTNISGATTNKYTITADKAGKYIGVTVTVAQGTNYSECRGTAITSNTIKDTEITIITNPLNVEVDEKSSNVSFSVEATGTNLRYAWYVANSLAEGGTAIAGATSSTYTITSSNVTKDLNGKFYYCVVTNNAYNIISDRAGLTVYYKPTIKTQPMILNAVINAKATITIDVEPGYPSVTKYKWQISKDNGVTWEDVEAGNGMMIEIPRVIPEMTGYQYRCVIGNNRFPNSVVSNAATLIVGKKSLNDSVVSARIVPTRFEYDGTEKKPRETVKYNEIRLIKDEDYTVSYANNINVGTGTVIITGIGDYQGEISLPFIIEDTGAPTNPTIIAKKDNYDGEEYISGRSTNKNIVIELISKGDNQIVAYEWSTDMETGFTTEGIHMVDGNGRIRFDGEMNQSIFFRAKDTEGLYSSVSEILIIIDKTAPIGTIDIREKYTENDVEYTDDNTIVIDVTATDNISSFDKLKITYINENVFSMSNSNDSIDWYRCDSVMTWETSPGDGRKVIYVIFKDEADNQSVYLGVIN